MPDNIITATDMMEAVRQTAMLADVSVSVWQGTRTDRELMEEVKTQNNARGDVGRVIKNLLAGADGPLKAVQSAHHAVRVKHHELTLQWVGDPHAQRASGPRLLPNALFNTYMTEMSALKREAENKLNEFCDQYDDLVVRARSNLGKMADDSVKYPTADQIRSLFRVSFDFEPIPESTRFHGLSPEVLETLTKRLQRKQARQLTDAQAAMWAEARKRVEHLVDRLGTTGSDPDGLVGAPRFKAATIEGVRALVTLLPGWNITGDAQALEIAADIEKLLDGVDAGELRKNTHARKRIAKEAASLANKMKSWGV